MFAVALVLMAGCVRRAAPTNPAGLPFQLQAEHVEPELISARHQVKPGQTLYRIARTYGLTTAELMDANGIEDPRALTVGQELVIPGASETMDVAPTELAAMIPPPPAKGSGDDPSEPSHDDPPASRRKQPKVSKRKVVMSPPGTPAPALPPEELTPPQDAPEQAPSPREAGSEKTPPRPPAGEHALPAVKAAPRESANDKPSHETGKPSREVEKPSQASEKPSREAARPSREAPERVPSREPEKPPGAREPEKLASREPLPDKPPLASATKPAAARLPERDTPLQWPLRGVLYARFGRKGRVAHDGIDLAAPAGSPVRTAAVGTVLFAGEQQGYGLIAIVEHDRGLITLYAHNRDLRVKTGQKVREGQVLATVGESGKTSGPHLHFEVRKEGVPVDPLELLGPVPPR